MPVTDSEILLLSNDDADLNEKHINIMRRLALECNNNSAAMIDRVSYVFIKSMKDDEDLQEIVDSLMMSLRYCNDDIRSELEEKLINIGLYQLQRAFEKVIELVPQHTDSEICDIFETILESDDFEQNLLEAAKESDAYADLIVTIANYQLEQYSTPPLLFRDNPSSMSSDSLTESSCVSCVPSLRP
jgi:hypothetical protein